MQAGIKESSSCIFPALTPSTPFELFCANVEAAKRTNKKFRDLAVDQQHEFEAFQLILATNSHPSASAAIVRVYRQWQEGFFKAQGQLASDPAAWCKASWEALTRVCEPLDHDAREVIRAKLEALPHEAADRFGGNITELSNCFRNLSADAVKYKAGYTDAALAQLLIRSAPAEYQVNIRMHLLEGHEDPTKVLAVFERLARATGACLGQASPITVKEEQLYYVGSPYRPQTAGRIAGPTARGGKRGGRGGMGRPQSGFSGCSPGCSISGRGGGPRGGAQGGGRGICMRCGRTGFHTAETPCPAASKECRNCGKTGHFSVVCKQTSNGPAARQGVASVRVGFVDPSTTPPPDAPNWLTMFTPPPTV
eukprot:GHVU01234108.1.p1 GENE.GHVU01234108.1~~GHVU01234108.1.p1  ORF type:complete len:366 (-),score=24.22 GHVU01234108.1:86-1183(-)